MSSVQGQGEVWPWMDESYAYHIRSNARLPGEPPLLIPFRIAICEGCRPGGLCDYNEFSNDDPALRFPPMFDPAGMVKSRYYGGEKEGLFCYGCASHLFGYDSDPTPDEPDYLYQMQRHPELDKRRFSRDESNDLDDLFAASDGSWDG